MTINESEAKLYYAKYKNKFSFYHLNKWILKTK